MTNVERLITMVAHAMEDIEHCSLTAEGLSEELAPLGEILCACLSQIREVYQFTAAIADGAFQAPIPDRHNYFVGPSKDLYYKLKHLAWQASEVAKGDYSQRVDFLGGFSDSFNYMITELESRERQTAELAEEKLRAVKKQNSILQRQMERQMFHYRAYRNFIYSFLNFRANYKQMMGEVYALFQEERYEEGRLLVARINDLMATEVITEKNYSNNDFVNAAMADLAGVCKKRCVFFAGQVYVPERFNGVENIVSPERVFNLSELAFSFLEIETHEKQSLHISGGEKNGWFSLRVIYQAGMGQFPPKMEECLLPESLEIMEYLKKETDKLGSLMQVEYLPQKQRIELSLHICTGR